MFYPVDSLRKGGRFHMCWIADSWPLRFAMIKGQQVRSQDILKLCEDLLEVIHQESGRPSNRFSLRLSSQLIRGLVRIFQKKVSLLVGELWVIKKKVMSVRSPNQRRPRRQTIPRLVVEEVPEHRVEEMIQNSGNAVAHVDNITLKEQLLPEYRVWDDNFGELNPNEAVQLLQDRTIEMMLAKEGTAHSVDLTRLDVSTEKATEKSRLVAHEAAMDVISEHDISVFNKSTGDNIRPAVDFDKEIPEISDIPPPEMSLPQNIIETEKCVEMNKPEDITQVREVISEQQENISLEDMDLDKLEEELRSKRRKQKLIIDKKTQFSGNLMRSRIDNVHVEQRCENVNDDVIDIMVPASQLCERPAHVGYKVGQNLAQPLMRMFLRRCCAVPRVHRAEVTGVEDVRGRMQTRQKVSREKTVEDINQMDEEPCNVVVGHGTIPHIHLTTDCNVTVAEPNVLPAHAQEQMDISDLLTQKILPAAEEYRDEKVPSPAKRARHSGYVSFRTSHNVKTVIDDSETDKENIASNEQSAQCRLTTLLREAGLADTGPDVAHVSHVSHVSPDHAQPQDTRSRRRESECSETPLGSLDRTKVSLGDSELTTDSRRLMRDEWGTQGTMHKIYRLLVAEQLDSISFVRLVQQAAPARSRLVAAKCFVSVLKLRQHGFILVSKDPDTQEIRNIALGPRLLLP